MVNININKVSEREYDNSVVWEFSTDDKSRFLTTWKKDIIRQIEEDYKLDYIIVAQSVKKYRKDIFLVRVKY